MTQGKKPIGPQDIAQHIQHFLDSKLAEVTPHNDWSWCEENFSWCGELLDFLIEGLEPYTQTLGITFQEPFPGPFRLWDEDQLPNGDHVRRFWTTALHSSRGGPLATIQTIFYHRHDRIALPHPLHIRGVDPDTSLSHESMTHELHRA